MRPGSPTASGREAAAPTLHLGIVSARDGILFLAVEPSGEALRRRLAEFVRGRAEWALWPTDRADLLELLTSGRLEEGINLYFARVGERWDPEFLHRELICVIDQGEAPRHHPSCSGDPSLGTRQ